MIMKGNPVLVLLLIILKQNAYIETTRQNILVFLKWNQKENYAFNYNAFTDYKNNGLACLFV